MIGLFFYGYFSLRGLGYFCLNGAILVKNSQDIWDYNIHKSQTDHEKYLWNVLILPSFMAVNYKNLVGSFKELWGVLKKVQS